MELYIQGKDHVQIILNLVENGPLVWPTVTLENETVRPKNYEELSDKEKLQADCDLKATNIVLQGTSLSKQERECKLYDEFDKFYYVKGETLHQYYLWSWVPTFLPGDDPIAYMNKAMAFLSAVFTPRYPSTNNQLRSSSNLRNQATVQDGRVTIQHVQGRQGQNVAEGKELDEEQLAFLADPGVANAKAVLMANLSSFDSDVLSEEIVQNTNTSAQQNFMILSMFEQMSNHANNWDKANNETQRIKPILYDGNVLSKTYNVLSVVDDEETLILVEESRLKMVEKQNDPIMKKEKINITQINYSELNKISKDFGKCFVPLQELSAKQKFWLQSFDKNSEEPSTSNTPVKIELQVKDTVISKLKETIHSLRENVNPAKVKKDIDEIETIKIELEHNLKTQIQEKVFANATLKNELRKLKGKTVIDTAVSKPYATTITPGMFKLNLESLALKVLKNKDAHLEYIKHSREHADILREIVESARALSLLDSNLDSACKYVQSIQEVLVYIRDTCPCLTRPSEKLVAVTPKNKDTKVRFVDPITSSSNT
ncbi:hypothetical protein Tco_1135615 [Tanacetum coccineum]